MLEKKAVVHIDDIGSSLNANRAAFSLLDTGRANSGSIMVPGHGFSDAVDRKNHITKYDIGVHLTLTSEWLTGALRWKPTLPLHEVPSLVDSDGYFRSAIDDVLYKAHPEEIRNELMHQIIIAQKSGIAVSHIDSHMGVLLHEKMFPLYKELADVFRIQPFLAKSKPGDRRGNRFYGCDKYIDNLVDNGFKVFDDFDANSLYQGEKDYNMHCRDRIQSIKVGTTYFLLHVLDDDIKDIEKTPDHLARQNEYRFFGSDIADRVFEEQHIKKITVKEL